MNNNFMDAEIERLRCDLERYRKTTNFSCERLRKQIAQANGISVLDVKSRTISRFLNVEHTPKDETLSHIKLFIETLPEPDPIYDLGDAFADFFSLPEDYVERRSYMERMRNLYVGRYDVWKITSPDAAQELMATIRLSTEPNSAFFQVDEISLKRFDIDSNRFDIDDKIRSSYSDYDGIAIPRENELFILLKELGVDHEKVYILRRIMPGETKNVTPEWVLIGNVIDKKLRMDRSRSGNLANQYKVALTKEKLDCDEDDFDEIIDE